MTEAAYNAKPYTWADYRDWDDDRRWELIDGDACLMTPSPTSRHQLVSGELGRQTGNHFRGRPCKVFSAPIDVVLRAGPARTGSHSPYRSSSHARPWKNAARGSGGGVLVTTTR